MGPKPKSILHLRFQKSKIKFKVLVKFAKKRDFRLRVGVLPKEIGQAMLNIKINLADIFLWALLGYMSPKKAFDAFPNKNCHFCFPNFAPNVCLMIERHLSLILANIEGIKSSS